MAEEAEEDAGGGGGSSDGGGDGGSLLKKYGPLAVIVLLAQVVMAWVIIQFALKDNMPEEQGDLIPPTEEKSVELRSGQGESKSRLPHYYTGEALNSITVNPAGTNSERFVVVSVQLGLEAYDHNESPPEDITSKLKDDTKVLEDIALYEQKIQSVIAKTVRLKTIDQLEGEFIHEIEDEIRIKLNKEIFERLFSADDEDGEKKEITVSEVDISSIIIQ